MKDNIELIISEYTLGRITREKAVKELLNLHIVSSSISDEQIKMYRKEGRMSGVIKREPFYKLIAKQFDDKYDETDFYLLYDC